MRHIIGFGLALVLAAAVFFGAAWGYLRLLRLPVGSAAPASALPAGGGSLLHDKNVLLAFAALTAVGLLAGLFVAAPRISPLAAGLPGLVLIAWTILYAVSVRRAVRYIPLKGDAFGAGFEAMLFNGILAAVGLVLIVPLFIPSRWRRGVQPVFVPLDATAGGGAGGPGGWAATAPPASSLFSPDWSETTQTIQQPPPLSQPPPDDSWQ